MIRILNKYKLYVKNSTVIEHMSEIDTIVFDKTGTITEQGLSEVEFKGNVLTNEQVQCIRSLAHQSNHPLSKSILSFLPIQKIVSVKNYQEIKGLGTSAIIHDVLVKMGSTEFVNGHFVSDWQSGSVVYISINDKPLGFFSIKNAYRKGLQEIITELGTQFELKILSGDNASEEPYLRALFGDKTEMLFNQKPQDKLNFIKQLQVQHKKVLMIGDGLNDAGALKQSEVGIAISDNTNNFSPACDAVLSGKNFKLLNELINYCRKEKVIIYASFVLSILYNFIGIFFAVQGDLMPVIAAILMPISSISIVLLTTGLSSYYELKLKKIII
jgi:Cu+-exporting ATPase